MEPNKLPDPAAVPNDAGVAAEPKRPPEAAHDGVPNVGADGVPNEKLPMPVPAPVVDVVFGVLNWNPPDMAMKFLLKQSSHGNKTYLK